MSEIEHVLSVHNKLGEGPLWSVEEQALYWVDIQDNCFFRFHPVTGISEKIDVEVAIGVLALRASGGLVLATKKGFAFWDKHTQELQYIVNPEATKPHMRFNDGAVDSAGRFWAGSMREPGEGTLYRLDPDRTVHAMVSGVSIPNGLGWSLDNTVMYFTDSVPRIIYAFDFDAATGNITNRRNLIEVPEEMGTPDGLAVDSAGYIWSAFWDGAKIVRYAPDGKVDRVVAVPALRPTSCVFGGPGLDELYITSSRADLNTDVLERYPLSGDLFRLKAGVTGPEKFKFAG